MSTFSPNIQYEEVARGADVGVWDTPTNSNWTITDLVVGGIATIPLNNSNIILSAAQFQSRNITFNSTLTGSVTITFPTSFTKSYEIQNLCTGSSAFLITLETTAGGQVICCPPGQTVDVFNDGSNLKFKNLPPVGSYVDYAGGAVPSWVANCTIPPYLDCNGSTFSAATYPALAVILATTTLPDARGRFRLALNEGTGRVTTANGGVDGNTNQATGGSPNHTLTLNEIPTGIQSAGSMNSPLPNVMFSNQTTSGFSSPGGSGQFNAFSIGSVQSIGTLTVTGTVTSNNTSGAGHFIMNPTYVGGITMIRAG